MENKEGFNFDKMPYTYWTDIMIVEWIQRFVIVHSILYYVLDTSIITDKVFDSVCKQLVKYQKQMDKLELKQTQYYYCMYDFDGSTGFHLYDRLKEKDKVYLTKIANILIGGL